MGSENYANEFIPDFETLQNNYLKQKQSLEEIHKYSFQDLFPEKNYNGRIEYVRNTSIWGDLYNNWLSDEYEQQKLSPENQKAKNEVKGIYVFYENDVPVYAGISRKILRRLRNHFLGKSHYEATLVYLMCRYDHEENIKELYKGERKNFEGFKKGRCTKQTDMRSHWKIAILPIENNYELYFTEIALACDLKTKWNSFETH